jgi:hypothetical protein
MNPLPQQRRGQALPDVGAIAAQAPNACFVRKTEPAAEEKLSFVPSPIFVLEYFKIESTANVQKLSILRAVQGNPIIPPPAKHAPNGMQGKHGQQAIQRA